jgi:hypothetical protein
MKRPKAHKGKTTQVKFLVDENEKKVLLQLVDSLQTSQAEVFRQALIYIAYKKGLENDIDPDNFYISA